MVKKAAWFLLGMTLSFETSFARRLSQDEFVDSFFSQRMISAPMNISEEWSVDEEDSLPFPPASTPEEDEKTIQVASKSKKFQGTFRPKQKLPLKQQSERASEEKNEGLLKAVQAPWQNSLFQRFYQKLLKNTFILVTYFMPTLVEESTSLQVAQRDSSSSPSIPQVLARKRAGVPLAFVSAEMPPF